MNPYFIPSKGSTYKGPLDKTVGIPGSLDAY